MSIRSIWEVTLDVSVLIIFLSIIRKIFKKKLNPSVVYFLWIFVLICTLIPIRIKVNIEAPDKAPYQKQGTIYNVPLIETVKLPEGILQFLPFTDNMVSDNMKLDSMGADGMNSDSMSPDSDTLEPQKEVSLNGIFYTVWGIVAATFLLYIVSVNIQLFLYVKHNRKPVGVWKNLKIYSLSGYNCLMGIMHPAIYVDTKGLGSRELIDSVIQHEYRHFKAKDNIWQLLRTICLILQWHNPLVWWAYYASKQDCELSCDASVVGKLSEEARYQYGRCLLTISEHKSRAAESMLLATSMGESAERLKERIELIMKYQQKRAKVLAIPLFCIAGFVSLISVNIVRAEATPASMTNKPENLSANEVGSNIDIEKMATSDTELIAPPLSYDYSQADEKYIYYIYYSEIRKHDLATGAEQSIYQSEGLLWCMEKYQDYLYFIEALDESGPYRLCSVSVDGEDVYLIDGNISNNALGITDNYLFVRSLAMVDGSAKIIDTIFEVESGKAKEFEPDSINYAYANSPDIYTNPESTEIQKHGELLFRTEQYESVNLLTYNSKYVFCRDSG